MQLIWGQRNHGRQYFILIVFGENMPEALQGRLKKIMVTCPVQQVQIAEDNMPVDSIFQLQENCDS
jgi:hypothetical protein